MFNKPWGYEFRYQISETVTLTYLTILPNSQTSLHCHPTKTTSLTAIGGSGSLQFLKDRINFTSGTSFMVRNGLFHQVINLGNENLTVLEFENPSDPQDLIRLEDHYGRKLLGYETEMKQKQLSSLEESFFDFIATGSEWENEFTEMQIKFPAESKMISEDDSIYAVLLGGLVDSITNSYVLRAGDCTTGATISRLVANFNWEINTKLLVIRKKA